MKDFGKKLSSTEKLGIDSIFRSGENDTGMSDENGAGTTEVSIYELIPYSRMVVHFVQSFDPKDSNITPELAKKIADEFASSIYFKEYQVVYAVHTDAGHIHTHFIINTTNVTNGFMNIPDGIDNELPFN